MRIIIINEFIYAGCLQKILASVCWKEQLKGLLLAELVDLCYASEEAGIE